MIKKITVDSEFFNPKDTLECGQIFRFFPAEKGYLVLSGSRACELINEGQNTVIVCDEENEQYFYNYFDLDTDYSGIFARAQSSKYGILKKASSLGKGVRILKQDSEEMLFSFLISQNNNIPRIKKIINSLCEKLGEKKNFLNHEYYAFPTASALQGASEDLLKECGLGYRAPYLRILSNEILTNNLLSKLKDLNEDSLKAELLKIKGIGEKVANCALLFGFYKTKSFPVDVWIEKIYREDFGGLLTDRSKITAFFINEFAFDAGYFQQYLFYYKRSLEKQPQN